MQKYIQKRAAHRCGTRPAGCLDVVVFVQAQRYVDFDSTLPSPLALDGLKHQQSDGDGLVLPGLFALDLEGSRHPMEEAD